MDGGCNQCAWRGRILTPQMTPSLPPPHQLPPVMRVKGLETLEDGARPARHAAAIHVDVLVHDVVGMGDQPGVRVPARSVDGGGGMMTRRGQGYLQGAWNR